MYFLLFILYYYFIFNKWLIIIRQCIPAITGILVPKEKSVISQTHFYVLLSFSVRPLRSYTDCRLGSYLRIHRTEDPNELDQNSPRLFSVRENITNTPVDSEEIKLIKEEHLYVRTCNEQVNFLEIFAILDRIQLLSHFWLEPSCFLGKREGMRKSFILSKCLRGSHFQISKFVIFNKHNSQKVE